MAAIDQMTQMTPGSNQFHPGKVFNPAVEATMGDLASQNLRPANPNPLSPMAGGVEVNPGATGTAENQPQLDPATGQTVTPTPIDPTVIPDPNTLTV